ncbi:heme-binding protein [Xanthobacter sp. V7C-4]|uniref:GlcG/HbpS family heme-binding protein n=2 Tax=Xanthobacter autotrophicus (strain ATCC BAA-1158 / Py2) TaxID=78245 RepID=UPI00372BF516
MMKHLLLAAVAAVSLVPAASAQVLQDKNMPLTIALDIAREAVAACAAQGYNVTAAVVDRAGVLRALARADNAGVHTPDAARRKAYTSASTRIPTSTMVENIQKTPAAAQLVAIDGFLVVAGGVPVKSGNEVIGAVGVGGAPGGQLDEACANAAIAKVEQQLK